MKATINTRVNRFFEFDSFRIDTRERLLSRDDEPIPLLPKAFDTLLVLVQHSGEVLDKDYLLKEVWPDSVVEENNLAQAISEIRKALSEGAKDQRFIVTVRSRGYRFAAEVRECLDEEIEQATQQHAQSVGTKQRVQKQAEEKQENRHDSAHEPPFLSEGSSESRPRAAIQVDSPYLYCGGACNRCGSLLHRQRSSAARPEDQFDCSASLQTC